MWLKIRLNVCMYLGVGCICIWGPPDGQTSLSHLVSSDLRLLLTEREQQQGTVLVQNVSQCWDTNSSLGLQTLLHKQTHSPDKNQSFWNSNRQHVSTDCTIFPADVSRSLGVGASYLPSGDWLHVGSASSEATLVPGCGSILTLFTFWKTQEKPRLPLLRINQAM